MLSTYEALNLDRQQPTKDCMGAESWRLQRSPHEKPKVINAWELMEGLEEGTPILNQAKKSPKPRAFLRGFFDFDARSPMKFSNQSGSPKKVKRFTGKENKGRVNIFGLVGSSRTSRSSTPKTQSKSQSHLHRRSQVGEGYTGNFFNTRPQPWYSACAATLETSSTSSMMASSSFDFVFSRSSVMSVNVGIMTI